MQATRGLASPLLFFLRQRSVQMTVSNSPHKRSAGTLIGPKLSRSTQRSLEHFRISSEKMPPELIRAMLLVKRSAALVNVELGVLPAKIAKAIVAAADE